MSTAAEIDAKWLECHRSLGLQPGASRREIRRAYLRLAHEFHPDKNPGDPRAEERFKIVSLAYRTLLGPEARAGYAATDDILARFGWRMGALLRKLWDRLARGQNLLYRLELDPVDALRGGRFRIDLPRGRLEVAVPPGTADGTCLRIAGEGEQGCSGGPPGDLLVVVRVRPVRSSWGKERRA